jgi:hypothetical protein
MKNFVIFSTRKIQTKASNDCQDRINVSKERVATQPREDRMLGKASVPSPFDHPGRLF